MNIWESQQGLKILVCGHHTLILDYLPTVLTSVRIDCIHSVEVQWKIREGNISLACGFHELSLGHGRIRIDGCKREEC